jgi:hypothetical protein
MKKLLKILVIGLIGLVLLTPVNCNAVNTYSLDLESTSSQYAYRNSTTDLGITTDFTLECWIKVESLTNGTSYDLITKAPSTPDAGYRLFLSGTATGAKLGMYWWSSSADTTNWSTNDFLSSSDIGNWVHVAVANDISEGDSFMYKNGVSQTVTNDASPSTTINVGTYNFAIGAYKGASPNSYFDGLIDEVRVWTDIRTSTEINDNKSVELVGNEANLLGYWKLNNDYEDTTANNYDLTAVNSPVFSTSVPFVGAVTSVPNKRAQYIEF